MYKKPLSLWERGWGEGWRYDDADRRRAAMRRRVARHNELEAGGVSHSDLVVRSSRCSTQPRNTSDRLLSANGHPSFASSHCSWISSPHWVASLRKDQRRIERLQLAEDIEGIVGIRSHQKIHLPVIVYVSRMDTAEPFESRDGLRPGLSAANLSAGSVPRPLSDWPAAGTG
jgi:hypothetical protein